MRLSRWRLRPLVVLCFVAVFAVAFFVAYLISRRYLVARLEALLGADQAELIISGHGVAFLAAAVIVILLAAGVAFALSTRAANSLVRLRNAITSRALGAMPVSSSGVPELRAVASAIERLASDLEERARELKEERDELSLLVASVSEGILLVDRDGRIVHANAAARALLGLPVESRGRVLSSLVRHVELRRVLEKMIAGIPVVPAEVTVGDNRVLVVARTTEAASIADGGRTGTVITLLDLTEVRRLEGVRRDFVANVSHELKTPLTSIRGYVETLLTDDLPADMRHQFLEVVQKNAERLHSIVDDLLDLSRLESGGWRPAIEPVAMNAVIPDAWKECADRARLKHIAFIEPTSDAVVMADPSALRQILLNLFDNAIRHTPDAGNIRVFVEAPSRARIDEPDPARNAEPEAFVSLRVEDSGAGIPQDALPRIFERFFRVDPARSRSAGGTGLGLSIVKHLTEAMGGSVSARSDLGKGTSVEIRLPAR